MYVLSTRRQRDSERVGRTSEKRRSSSHERHGSPARVLSHERRLWRSPRKCVRRYGLARNDWRTTLM